MSSTAQRRAVTAHRQRQVAAGVTRFEVAAPQADKELVRGIARRLAGPDAAGLRAELARIMDGGQSAARGGIWRALRASPLVGADLMLERDADPGRDVEL
jgi:hypothetical protein